MSAVLSASGLAYGYPGHTLGRDLSLAVDAGQVLCVLGPNGGGKSTLFRTLLGLIPSHAGHIHVGGRDLEALDAAARARAMAYVPQAGGSYFPFRVRDVVLMGRTAHIGVFGAPGQADYAAAEAAMAELKIESFAGRDFSTLSGGERQLVLIARALAQAAPLLIMDEPTASLDFGNQALILTEIRRLKASGRTLLFCSHDPDHALHCADQVLLLRRGGVLAAGPAREVVTAENLRALYGIEVEMLGDAERHRVACRPLLDA